MTRTRESEARRWATRRAKYGGTGHFGAYRCGQWTNSIELARLIAYVNLTGLMSEGELANLLNMDRISVRCHRDTGRDHIEAQPPRGEWGKGALARMEGEDA
jgi:hypothetical protein